MAESLGSGLLIPLQLCKSASIAVALVGASAIVAAASGAIWHPPNKPIRRDPIPPAKSTDAQLRNAVSNGRLLLSEAQLDQALATGTLDRPVKSLLKVDKPLHFGEFVWNDSSIPDGRLWMRVDLHSQLISVFRGQHEIGTSVIVYGGDNKETPSGKFRILARDRDHRSSVYDAAMPYTLQLTGDGVAIHGSTVRWGAATHGCIGVPLEFARILFDQAHVGDEVVIVPGAVAS